MDKDIKSRNDLDANLPSIADAASAMSSAFQFPADYARTNMQFMQHRLSAYAEFAQRCASCQKPEEIMDEYAQFGERLMTDYSSYFHGLTDAWGRATREEQ